MGRQFEKRRDKFERKMGTLDRSKTVLGKFFWKSAGERPEQERCNPERTVGTLYRSVSPDDSTGADRAGIYRARVGVNVTAYE